MKVSFGPGIYEEAMASIGVEFSIVTFNVDGLNEFETVVELASKNRCDMLITFGDEEPDV